MSSFNEIKNKDSLTYPKFIDVNTSDTLQLVESVPSIVTASSANFYRTELNTNILIEVPIGDDAEIENIYTSPNMFLPVDIFNAVKETDYVMYPDKSYAKILQESVCVYDILIQYKMAKPDGTNFGNQREIRTTLVKEDGNTMYDETIFSDQQPDTGQHDNIVLKGYIAHNVNDIVKIRFNITQENSRGDYTDTLITIFRISWNMIVKFSPTPTANSVATFYRTNQNANIAISIPVGTDPTLEDIYTSTDIYLPLFAFNARKENSAVQYINNKDAKILKTFTYLHDILIQYKLTKGDGSNFVNQREIRTTLVKQYGLSIYDESIFSNQQPDTGQYDYILIKGIIAHIVNDIVMIRFNIIQDNKLNGLSETLLTIFHISWNIFSDEPSNIVSIPPTIPLEGTINFKQVNDDIINYVLSEYDYAIEVTNAAYNTISLPSAYGIAGRTYMILNGSDNVALVLRAFYGDNINGDPDVILERNTPMKVVCNGRYGWYII